MKRFSLALAVAGLLALGSTAQATVVGPGGSVVPDFTVLSGGTVIDSTSISLTSSSGASDWTATVHAVVYREASGFLTFVYQVVNDAASGEAIRRATHSPYTGFATDASYADPADIGGPFVAASSNPPGTATRSATGAVVGFQDFDGGIAPGQATPLMVIRTNAKEYTPGTTSLINGGVDSGITFAPGPEGGPVPEPASVILLGGCFAGLAGAGIFRRRKAVVPVS